MGHELSRNGNNSNMEDILKAIINSMPADQKDRVQQELGYPTGPQLPVITDVHCPTGDCRAQLMFNPEGNVKRIACYYVSYSGSDPYWCGKVSKVCDYYRPRLG
jgi:hypothetical protein